MIVIQKLTKLENGTRQFLCVAQNISDMATAEILALALSEGWSPATAEEGVYIYDPASYVASKKYVNGALASGW